MKKSPGSFSLHRGGTQVFYIRKVVDAEFPIEKSERL